MTDARRGEAEEQEEDSVLLHAVTQWDGRRAGDTFFRVKAWCSVAIALLLPSPFGYWSPSSLILWGLVGDPGSFWDAAGSVVAGIGIVGVYALTIFTISCGGQRVFSRGMEAMAARNRKTLAALEKRER